MKPEKRLAVILTAVLAAMLASGCGKKGEAEKGKNKPSDQGKDEKKKQDEKKKTVQINAEIDSSPWSRLLAKYVDGRGLVDYARWKDDGADRDALARYVEAIGRRPNPAAGGVERISALANAYNALTISWILQNYPIASIQATKHAFTEARFDAGGQKVSLDDIEKGSLVSAGGYRIHAPISCASRSCPPLANKAFTAAGIEDAMNRGMTVWLSREDLNAFDPATKKADISQVFKWDSGDFEKARGVQKVLARYAPAKYRESLAKDDYKIEYKPYDWGLNDQGKEGHHYTRARQGIDAVRDRLR